MGTDWEFRVEDGRYVGSMFASVDKIRQARVFTSA